MFTRISRNTAKSQTTSRLASSFPRKLNKSRKGLAMLDVGVALVIIGVITLYFFSKSEAVNIKSDESQLTDSIATIFDGARSYREGVTDGYTSVTMALLATGKFVPAQFAQTGGNPAGGDFTLSGTATTLTVNATTLSTELCNRAADKLAINATASCDTSTNTITVTGS